MLKTLLNALEQSPNELPLHFAVADCLEEGGEGERAELTRLSAWIRHRDGPQVEEWKERQRELLASGVLPCVPEVVNSVGMRLALIPAGHFLMGSPAEEAEREEDEGPQHEVEITKPFYMGVFPVTQAEYEAVMGYNPSCFKATGSGRSKVNDAAAGRFPVESVSWQEAVEFCRRLSLREKETGGQEYRLPTEAEWEYACRAGTTTAFYFGNSLSSKEANFDGNHPYGGAEKGPDRRCSTVLGSFRPNPFGLYDMHGNVKEWCSDWYDEGYYGTSPRRDPQGPDEPDYLYSRVLRGGSWYNNGRYCRAAFRYREDLGFHGSSFGFRVVRCSK